MESPIREFTFGCMVEYWDDVHELWKKGHVININKEEGQPISYEINPCESSCTENLDLDEDEVRQIPQYFLKGETVYIPSFKCTEESYDKHVIKAEVVEFLSTSNLYLVRISSCNELIWMERHRLFDEKDDAVCHAELMMNAFNDDVKKDEEDIKRTLSLMNRAQLKKIQNTISEMLNKEKEN